MGLFGSDIARKILQVAFSCHGLLDCDTTGFCWCIQKFRMKMRLVSSRFQPDIKN